MNGRGRVGHEVPDADDFVHAPEAGGPDWHLESVVYEIFPDRFATSGLDVEAPDWAVRREWDALPRGSQHEHRSSSSSAETCAASSSTSTTSSVSARTSST